jgi:hypothetical protein
MGRTSEAMGWARHETYRRAGNKRGRVKRKNLFAGEPLSVNAFQLSVSYADFGGDSNFVTRS